MNQILNTLPNCYRQGDAQQEIADALTAGADSKLTELLEILDNYSYDYLDPATCMPEWLDIIAYWSAWSNLWDSSWSEATKRQLLINSDYIWSNRGNRDVLTLLFQIFNITAVITPNAGWVIGVSLLPVSLNADPFAYTVKVPTNYTGTAPELAILRRLLKDFLPCWLELTITNT